MDELENVIDIYYKKLSENSPHVTLTNFYCHLFELPFSADKLPTFGKMVRIFGREIVFFAIIDMFGVPNLSHDNIFPLLKYFCMKRFKENKSTSEYTNLSTYIEEVEKQIEKNKKSRLKIKEPFDE